jgi:hypothetical protein
MKEITTVGVDLAKSVFTVHGVDATGRTVLHKTVRRAAVVVAEELPVLAREAVTDLRTHLSYLDERIARYERQLVELAR